MWRLRKLTSTCTELPATWQVQDGRTDGVLGLLAWAESAGDLRAARACAPSLPTAAERLGISRAVTPARPWGDCSRLPLPTCAVPGSGMCCCTNSSTRDSASARLTALSRTCSGTERLRSGALLPPSYEASKGALPLFCSSVV